MEKIKSYFDRYPQSQEVFENNGVLFHDRGAAESYSTGEYTRHTRKQVEDAAGATVEQPTKGEELGADTETEHKEEEPTGLEPTGEADPLDGSEFILKGEEVETIPVKIPKESNTAKSAKK